LQALEAFVEEQKKKEGDGQQEGPALGGPILGGNNRLLLTQGGIIGGL
jgi:hypothetical protein